MGRTRLQYSSDYEYDYDAAESDGDDGDDGDDYEPPSTPKRKKKAAPSTPKAKTPKFKSATPKTRLPKKSSAVKKPDDKPFPLFELPGELCVFFFSFSFLLFPPSPTSESKPHTLALHLLTVFISSTSLSIDEILASPQLHLRDHLSLAASCRTLRSVYYSAPSRGKSIKSSNVWKVLNQNRAFTGLGWSASPGKQARPSKEDEKLLTHLWSREDRVRPEDVKVDKISEAWDDAIDAIHSQVSLSLLSILSFVVD
jgi:hypothetical protein